MAGKQNFMDWMFKHRDIDGLIIAFLVSGAVATFINDLTIAVMDPIIMSLLPKNYDEVYQTLNILDIIVIRFQLQYILSGIMRMLLTLGVAFLFVQYLYKVLQLQVGAGVFALQQAKHTPHYVEQLHRDDSTLANGPRRMD